MSEVNPEKLQRDFEQLQAMLRDLAPVLATFWKELIEEGMTPEAATEICSDYVLQLSRGNK